VVKVGPDQSKWIKLIKVVKGWRTGQSGAHRLGPDRLQCYGRCALATLAAGQEASWPMSAMRRGASLIDRWNESEEREKIIWHN